MKIYLIFAILLCFVITEARSQTPNYSKNPSKMSKYDFLTLTTNSDSLTAVVNMFFRKRRNSTSTGLVLSGGAMVIGIIVSYINLSTQVVGGVVGGTSGEETNDSGGTIALVGLVGGGLITTIGRSSFNKNKLMKVITEYQETKKIPNQYGSKLVPRDFDFKTDRPVRGIKIF